MTSPIDKEHARVFLGAIASAGPVKTDFGLMLNTLAEASQKSDDVADALGNVFVHIEKPLLYPGWQPTDLHNLVSATYLRSVDALDTIGAQPHQILLDSLSDTKKFRTDVNTTLGVLLDEPTFTHELGMQTTLRIAKDPAFAGRLETAWGFLDSTSQMQTMPMRTRRPEETLATPTGDDPQEQGNTVEVQVGASGGCTIASKNSSDTNTACGVAAVSAVLLALALIAAAVLK